MLGLFGIASFPIQGLVFIVVSLACVLLLRKPFLTRFHLRNRTGAVDSLVGEMAKTLESIAPQATGRVELRGSTWPALNTGAEPIPHNVHCRVEKVQGLTLHVKP